MLVPHSRGLQTRSENLNPDIPHRALKARVETGDILRTPIKRRRKSWVNDWFVTVKPQTLAALASLKPGAWIFEYSGSEFTELD